MVGSSWRRLAIASLYHAEGDRSNFRHAVSASPCLRQRGLSSTSHGGIAVPSDWPAQRDRDACLRTSLEIIVRSPSTRGPHGIPLTEFLPASFAPTTIIPSSKASASNSTWPVPSAAIQVRRRRQPSCRDGMTSGCQTRGPDVASQCPCPAGGRQSWMQSFGN